MKPNKRQKKKKTRLENSQNLFYYRMEWYLWKTILFRMALSREAIEMIKCKSTKIQRFCIDGFPFALVCPYSVRIYDERSNWCVDVDGPKICCLLRIKFRCMIKLLVVVDHTDTDMLNRMQWIKYENEKYSLRKVGNEFGQSSLFGRIVLAFQFTSHCVTVSISFLYLHIFTGLSQ